jgi:hypothetical protein
MDSWNKPSWRTALITGQNIHPYILYHLEISISDLFFKVVYWKEAGHNTERQISRKDINFNGKEKKIFLFLFKKNSSFLSQSMVSSAKAFFYVKSKKFLNFKFLKKKVQKILFQKSIIPTILTCSFQRQFLYHQNAACFGHSK